jgi:hypothetical protein
MYYRFIFCLLLATFSHFSEAANGFVKGQVQFIRSHDATAHPGWSPPLFWFTLKNVTSAGSCSTFFGSVLLVAADKQALSLIVSAQATGQEIAVYWDDTKLTNGYCAAQFVTIGNPAPTY